MSKVTWKGSVQMSPLPAVLVTSKSGDKENVFTVAWTGVCCSQPPKVYISIRPERYSYSLIEESREFVINLTTADMARAVDFCGVRSGRDMDKFEACDLEKEPAAEVAAPILAASPLALECKVFDIIKLGCHDMFLADVVAVRADEKYIDEKGKFDLSKAGLIAYTHGEYYEMGKKLGSFGYTVRKKPAAPKKKRSTKPARK